MEYLSDAYGTRTRRSAVAAVRGLCDDLDLTSERRGEISTALAACITQGSSWLQMPAARALGALGPDAAPALPVLREKLADDDLSKRARSALENALAQIEPDEQAEETAPTMASADEAAENKRLREQLASLQEEHDELQRRVTSLEALVNGYQAVLDQVSSRAPGRWRWCGFDDCRPGRGVTTRDPTSCSAGRRRCLEAVHRDMPVDEGERNPPASVATVPEHRRRVPGITPEEGPPADHRR